MHADDSIRPFQLDPLARDPLGGLPRVPAELGSGLPDAGAPGLHLVQLRGPVHADSIERLEGAGVEVLQYFPVNGLAVLATAEEMDVARAAAPVRWAGRYPAALKLAPPYLRLASRRTGSGPTKLVEAVIQLFETPRLAETPGGSDAFRRHLARAGGRVISTTRAGNRVHVRASIPETLLAALARWPSVFRIEPFPEYRLLGERSAVIAAGGLESAATCVTPGYRAWLERKGVDGSGITVQLMDDGVEQGDASGIPGTAHEDLLGRIAGSDNTTEDPESDSRSGHGSFNAALLCGTAASGNTNAAGFLPGLGVAPGSRVFASKIFNNLGRFQIGSRSFRSLASAATQAGAVISANSWGADLFGRYDFAAVEFDSFARDVHDDPGEQLLAFIFAAGNAGDTTEKGLGTIASPASAKNVISVGASEGCASEPVDGCGVSAFSADSLGDVPMFSSRGPLADGRLAPTLVAPGSQIEGIASSAAGYDGTGLCDRFWPLGQVLYTRSSGTSHACPIVAGAAALFHEWRTGAVGSPPSPALVKAALVASARDLAGGNDGFGGAIPPAPSPIQGWGLVSMDGLVPDAGSSLPAVFHDQETVFTRNGDQFETIVFPRGGGPMKIVLAWSDPPGMPDVAPVLVNDLDLVVESGADVFLGNVFDAGASAPGGERDSLNNLECVVLGSPAAFVKVRVIATGLPGDGMPGGARTDQDFALAILGATSQSERGVVTFRRPAFGCGSLAGVTLSDAHLKGNRTALVTLRSTASPAPLEVVLTEKLAEEGVFEAEVPLGDGPAKLRVEHGGSIEATYLDGDAGSGAPGESRATALIDCEAPTISAIAVGDLTLGSARIRWETSEETRGAVRFGTSCPDGLAEESSPRRSLTHEVLLDGLAPNTRHFFQIAVTDAVDNETVADGGGACFSFFTSGRVCVFEDDCEPTPVPGWTHSADIGPDDWGSIEFAGAQSPTHAWHAGAFDGFKDSSLVMPAVEILPGDRLTFSHTFQLEIGFDGAVLEISTDGGVSFTDLGPFLVRGGYVDVVSGSPLGDRPAWTGTRAASMTPVEVDLSTFAGPGRRIRFRIVCDSSNAQGFGWFIDDIALCRSLNKRGEVKLDRAVLPCGARADIRVSDLDLIGAGSIDVAVASSSKPDGLVLRLEEDPASPGVHRGSIELGEGEGRLPARDGDEVLVEYSDADDGSDEGPKIRAARVPVDCSPPVISEVRVLEMLDDEATIAWSTDEPAIGEVLAGASCASPDTRRQEALGGTSHVVLLDRLAPGATLRYRVSSRDEAGNESIGEPDACSVLTPIAIHTVRHDFDEGPAGWRQVATREGGRWGVAESPDFARTPPGVWGYTGPESISDVSLVSPAFVVPPGGYISFWHTYAFELGFDGGVLEISADGYSWVDLGSEIHRGGYDSVLEAPNPLAGRRAWTGGTLGPMTRVLVDLGRWSDQTVLLRFRAATDSTVGGGAWLIDHFEICLSASDAARLTFDRSAYPCGGTVAIQLLDSGMAGRGSIDLRVTSPSEPGGEVVRLAEMTLGSGAFRGSVELDAQGGAGKLGAREGDLIRAAYLDGRGSDPDVEIVAMAPVDCSAPVIGDVRIVESLETSARIVWTTAEPSSGHVEAGAACGALGIRTQDGPVALEHSARLADLVPGQVYRFRVVASDLAGNTAFDDAGGACFELRTPVSFIIFQDDLQPAAEPGWSAGARWRVGASPFAHSPLNVWVIDGDGRRLDSPLLFPPVEPIDGSTLELYHAFEAAEGREGAVIEASTDGGLSWMDLDDDIVEGGYTGFIDRGAPLEGRRAWTGGGFGPPARVRVSLDRFAGAPLLLRLRWASPGEELRGGWVVDDIRISAPVGSAGRVAFSLPSVRCGAAASVFLADADLAGAGQAAAVLSSSGAPAPLDLVLLEETRGFFRGSFTLSSAPGPGVLAAAHADTLEVRYADARGADGAPAEAIAGAGVDCVPPFISNLRVRSGGLDGLEVSWNTDEPAGGRLLHGATCGELGVGTPGSGFGLLQTARIDGLVPGTTVFLRVAAADIAGNVSSLPASPECGSVDFRSECAFDDSFEPPRNGWTHAAAVGQDDWRIVAFPSTRSPPSAFHSENSGDAKDAALTSPPIDIPDGAFLTFFHTFELEEGFDGARIEASADGTTFTDLGSMILEGGYNGSIDGVAAWTGGTVGAMKAVRVSLEGLAGPGRKIRFRILCDDSVGSAGWFIDDVSVCISVPGTAESRFTRGNCSPDDLLNITDAVFLLNHLFLGGEEPACFAACDVDGSDFVNITDAIILLNYLFLGGPPPQQPSGCESLIIPGSVGCEGDSCLSS